MPDRTALTPATLSACALRAGLTARVRSDLAVEVRVLPESGQSVTFHFDRDGGYWIDQSNTLHHFGLEWPPEAVLNHGLGGLMEAEFWRAVSSASTELDRLGDLRGRPAVIADAVVERIERTKSALDEVALVVEIARSTTERLEASQAGSGSI